MKTNITAKQTRFCEEYLIDLNAAKAAIRAGYSKRTASEQGYQLLQKTSVRLRIKELMETRRERLKIDCDMILEELCRIAFVDIRELVNEDGRFRAITDMPESVRRAIVEISLVKVVGGGQCCKARTLRIRFHDKIKALELVGRHLGLFKSSSSERISLSLEDLLGKLSGSQDQLGHNEVNIKLS